VNQDRNQAPAVSAAAPRFVVLVPGLRLVTLTNGAQFARYAKHKIKRLQEEAVVPCLHARSLRCPFVPPMVVTITRQAPARMDSDNVVASAKYVRDCIARWIGIDDRHDDLVEYVVRQEQTPRGVYGVRIEIASRAA